MCAMKSADQGNHFADSLVLIVCSLSAVVGGSLISLIFYILSIRSIRQSQIMFHNREDVRAERVILYPTILFLSFLPTMIQDFCQLFMQSKNIVLLQALRIVISHSIGLTNALTYGYQRRSYYTLKTLKTLEADTIDALDESVYSVHLDSIEQEWEGRSSSMPL